MRNCILKISLVKLTISKKGFLMKTIFFGFLFATSSVFACPQLAGTYSCTGSEAPYKMEITQSLSDEGVTTYTATLDEEVETYIADGVSRPQTETVDGEEVNGTLVANCSGNQASARFIADYHGFRIDYNDVVTLLEDGSLSEEIVTYVDGQVYSAESYICTRTN
jgi:hypothetical protein